MSAALLLSLALAAAPPVAEAQLLDGTTRNGPLVALDERAVKLGDEETPLDRIVRLRPAAPPERRKSRPALWVTLIDGTELHGATFTSEKGKAQVGLVGGETVELPTRSIATVRLKPHADKLREQWDEILKSPPASDLVIVRKNDALDFLEGALGGFDGKSLQFQVDGETIAVKRERIEGLVFFHPRADVLAEPVGKALDAAGGEIPMRRARLDGERLLIETPAAVTIPLPLAEWSGFDFSSGKILYLSDHKPDLTEYKAAVAVEGAKPLESATKLFGPKFDRADEGALRLDKRTIEKGLLLRSTSRVVWTLPRRFGKLAALVGIHDDDRGRGEVKFTIRADDRVVFTETISATQPPKALELDISGARRISIVVEPPTAGYLENGGGHLVFGDAKVIK